MVGVYGYRGRPFTGERKGYLLRIETSDIDRRIISIHTVDADTLEQWMEITGEWKGCTVPMDWHICPEISEQLMDIGL